MNLVILMSRTRGQDHFTRVSETRQPKKVFLLACEGRHTERRYFQGLNEVKHYFKIADYIDIEIFKKGNQDNSHPLKIFEELKLKVKKNGIEADELCLIIDRDPHSFKDYQLDELIQKCKEEGYSIYLTNPRFEFWLLLHFLEDKLTKEEKEKILFENGFLEKKLQDFLKSKFKLRANSFNKKIKFCHYNDRVNLALSNGNLYEEDINKLKDKIGTNIHKLIDKMTDKEK